ncbi:MAG: polysaccharide biosynthesis C-terminal domain-containing protein, partial [Rhodospirillaceae bacterium]|nr:polysaccharide biosynthesis C-terminal domain-containing protein [Rhodospirillaceae bacterium]
SMLVNLVGNLTLIWSMGHVGVAAATALSAWVNVVILYAVLHRRDQLRADARLISRGLRITLASAIMGLALWYAGPLSDRYMAGTFLTRVLALGLLCGGGALVYAVAIFGTGAYRLSELKSLVSRRQK